MTRVISPAHICSSLLRKSFLVSTQCLFFPEMPQDKAKGLRYAWSEKKLLAADQAVSERSSMRGAAKANRVPVKTVNHRHQLC